MKTILSLFSAALLLAACSSKTESIETKTIEPRNLFPAGVQSELFQQIAPAPQKFTLNVKRDTAVICKNGTVISIPAACFVDAEGRVVTDNISLEVVEAQTYGDMLRYNLQTVSNGRVLQTGGMLYIDAKANGQSLALQKDAALYVELPTKAKQAGMKLFSGAYDSTGNVNWEEAGALEEGITPLPLEEFEYLFCKRYSNYDRKRDVYRNLCIDSLLLHKNKKYENTYLATLEFEQRFSYMDYASWAYEDLDVGLLFTGVPTDTIDEVDVNILNFYLKNTDKPLWHADSLAYHYMLKKEHEDSIKMNKQFGKTYEWSRIFSPFFKKMFDQRIGNVKKFDPRGVDLSKSNAKELLIAKGYNAEQAADQLRMFRTREQFRVQRRADRTRQAAQDHFHSENEKFITNAFKVTKLGWVNVDRFMDDPQAKEVEFFVEIKGDSLPLCDVTLLIPGRSIAMNGFHISGNNYRFTKTDKMYSKLPVGERAAVVVMASKNKQPYFAIHPLKIQEKQSLVIEAKKSDWKEIEKILAQLDKETK